MTSYEGQGTAAGTAEVAGRVGTARHAWIGFWLSMGLLFAATLGLTLLASFPTQPSPPPVAERQLEIPKTEVERIIAEAADHAERVTLERIPSAVDDAFRPVYDSIEAYADFHYSVLGEYVELTEMARRNVGGSIEGRLFAGFGSRLEDAFINIDSTFDSAFRDELARRIEDLIPKGMEHLPLSAATEIALQDARDRAVVAMPITAASAAAGVASAKIIAGAVGRKLLIKIGARAAAKTAAKGAGGLGGVGAGAAIGAFLGPAGAVVGGAVGGVAAWVAADAVIINVDEFFNREEFVAELRVLVDEEKAGLQAAVEADVSRKADAVAGRTIREVRDAENQDQ